MISHVILLPQWQRGAEGLEHLRRLQPTHLVLLYAVAGCQVTAEDAAALRAEFPFEFITRGEATLGVAASDRIGACRISQVTPGLAADEAGLREGDVIESLDGKQIPNFDHLVELLKSYRPGDEVTLVINTNQHHDLNPAPFDPLPAPPPRPKTEKPRPENVKNVILSDWSQLPDFPTSNRFGR